MSSEFINGSKYAFSSAFATAVAMTALTNAAPPVATTDDPITEGLVALIKSGWGDINEQAVYMGASGELEGLDTTDLAQFPAGEGVGSLQTVSEWTSLTQIRSADQSGGDQNFFNYGYIDDKNRRQRSKPTDRNPLVLPFVLDYDPDLPWYQKLIDMDGKFAVMRETLPSGDVLLYTGYLSFQKSPTRVRNENMTVTATFSINSDIIRYPASFFTGS